MAARAGADGVGELFRAALRTWGLAGPRRMLFLARTAWRMWRAERRRRRSERRLGAPVPYVLALSPTLRCNYACAGCYARGRPTDDEMTAGELDALLAEAERLGVLAVVVTGGEPFGRDDVVELMGRHRRLCFVVITNGALMTEALARRLARGGHVTTLVSIEGSAEDTDARRGPGAHAAAARAMALLADAGACFGFAAMVTPANAGTLGSEAFVDGMVSCGCSTGYFVEYVPIGPAARTDWVLGEDDAERFRRRVLDLRARKRIVLVHFPHDEYGSAGRCSAAGSGSLHVDPAGDVEPCPFSPVSAENVRDVGLAGACRSAFLRAIREHPDLLRRRRLPCALFEHRDELAELARRHHARPTG